MNLFENKSDWNRVRLDEVVMKIEENDRKSAQSKFDAFVKVEHMEAESLHLRCVGSQKQEELPPTFYKIFRKGQILFPTRNPHLKRTALAPCDGICGEKTLTLEVNPEIADPKLIPFLFHSTNFYNHSVGAIIGSTNPHCRWRDIANFEFLLPPKDQQAKLAELLWAADTEILSEDVVSKKLEIFLKSAIENDIHGVFVQGRSVKQLLTEMCNKQNSTTLKECGEFLKGKGIPKSSVVDSGIPCVRYGELYTHHFRVIRQFNSYIDKKNARSALRLKKNDVLFAGSGETIAEIGKSAAFVSDEEAYAGSDILVFRPKEMDGTFLGYLMNSHLVRQQLNKYGTGATVMHIYKSDLEKIVIPKVSLDGQIEIGLRLESFARTLTHQRSRTASSKQLLKSIINQVF